MQKVLKATAFIVLFFLRTYAQVAKSPTYVINGRFSGADSGRIYSLSPDGKVIDSAAIVDGKFILNGKLDLPEQKIFRINPGHWEFPAFVDAPRITFDIDTLGAEHYYSGGIDHPMIRLIKETGSPLADVYDSYLNGTGIADYIFLSNQLKFASKDSVGYFNSKIDSISKLIPEKQKFWMENYIRQNPASMPGIYLFKEYYSSLHDTSAVYLRSMLGQFSGPAKASSYYKALMNKLSALETVRVGELAPDFTLLKRDKHKFKLSSTRGAVVMLDFWASWCKPCRAGIPEWKKVYAKYHQKGFNIVSVSDDRSWGDWVKALDQERMPWIQVIDEFPSKTSPAIVTELYVPQFLPHYVLIDKQGKIVIASGDEHVVKRKIADVLK